MKNVLLSAMLIMVNVYAWPAQAANVVLRCKLQAGTGLSLEISNKHILNDGKALNKLDQKSVVLGNRYIAFRQQFPAYDNEWRIDRTSHKLAFKTVLKSNLHVVLDEAGSCIERRTASKPLHRKQASNLTGKPPHVVPSGAARREKTAAPANERTAWLPGVPAEPRYDHW